MPFRMQGEVFAGTEDAFWSAIAVAHADKDRPQCLCRDAGVPMYISRHGNGYSVKRMPNTAALHSLSCKSHDITSPTRAATKPSVVRTGADTFAVRLGFPLRPRQERALPIDRHRLDGSRGDRSQAGLSLSELLALLWWLTGLDRWHPGFVGKRNWALVRALVLRAAARVETTSGLLADQLFVPPVFDPVASRVSIASPLRGWSDRQRYPTKRLKILLAEVKQLAVRAEAVTLVLKQLPGVEVRCRSCAMSALPSLTRWAEAVNNERIRFVVAATSSVEHPHGLLVERIEGQPLSRQWLPLSESVDVDRIDPLFPTGAQFAASS